mgnify:CR=1 FL=1
MSKKARESVLAELIKEYQKGQGVITGAPRSLFIRHLDCGSCNACELELTALTNPIYDIARWGVRFEASPRHADVLALTGPYTRSLDKAARATLEAMPVPRIVIIGDCAAGDSVFEEAYGVVSMPEDIRQAVVAKIRGCPPTPDEVLRVLLQLDIKTTTNRRGR